MKILLWMFVVSALGAISARAAGEGDSAPDFRAPSTAGGDQALADFSGKWLVLYFYPKSFTPGCTTEACTLRDGYADILKTGAQIVGVSVDSIETQTKFKAKYNLPFDLLADEEGEIVSAYGVARSDSKRAQRVTFIISPEGKIARVINSVKPAEHDAQVLSALSDLQKAS